MLLKNRLIGVFILFMLVVATGCGNTNGTTNSLDENISTENDPPVILDTDDDVDLMADIETTRPWNIAFITKAKTPEEVTESVWLTSLNEAAAKVESEFDLTIDYIYSGCTDLTIENGKDCTEAQIRAVNGILESDVDGLVLIPLESDRLVPVVDKVVTSGIPVITFDTPLNSENLVTSLAFDNYSAGLIMGEWVANRVEENSNVLILEGNRTNANANDRKDGFLAGLATGDINVLGLETANWDETEGEMVTEQWLTQYENIDVIMAANDRMALGAIRAIEKAGLTEDIIVTGFDGSTVGLDAIHAGQLAATIDQASGLHAEIAIRLMIRHLENEENFPAIVSLPDVVLIDQDNIEQ